VQLNALFCCLWHNVEASCHKYFVVFSRNQHCGLLPAMCHKLRLDGGRGPPATALTTTDLLQGSRRNIAIPFGMEKLEWCGYPTVKKFPRYFLFVLTVCTNVTDKQTLNDSKGCA